MSLADTVIATYRSGFDDLAAVVAGLSDEDLARSSAADRWTVAQVLSHLGSGAAISRAGLAAAIAGEPGPGLEHNKAVWARWDAMPAREQADEFVAANRALAEAYEALDANARENLRVDVGFMPAPVDVATLVCLRLNELTLHSWDVRVTFDANETLRADAVGQLLRGVLPLSFIGKAAALDGRTAVLRVSTTDPDTEFALRLEQPVAVEPTAPSDPDGTLVLPAEAWLRLVAGRLTAGRTPQGVAVTGAVDLDQLRAVFPGY